MKTTSKIVLIIIDTITFGFGTGNIVAGVINESQKKFAGIGAFMIVFGFLIHYWRKNYFQSSANSEPKNTPKNDEKINKNLVAGILAIISFTFLANAINKATKNSFAINKIEDKVYDLNYKVDDLENHFRY
jgi:uncharacterized membrane protein YedE/YeeE